MDPARWAAADAMREALAKGIRRVACPTCGRPVGVVWRIEDAAAAPMPGPVLGQAEGDGLRVVAVRHGRFCSLRCDLVFLQERLRRDGPEARIACGLFARRG